MQAASELLQDVIIAQREKPISLSLFLGAGGSGFTAPASDVALTLLVALLPQSPQASPRTEPSPGSQQVSLALTHVDFEHGGA
jgi:hypothetical protein